MYSKVIQIHMCVCVCVCVCTFSDSFPSWLLQNIEYSSLCCTVGPCRLSIHMLLLLLLLLSHFSHVRLSATPETTAHQAPPSLGFSRQEHWNGLPFPSPMQESEKWKWSRSVVSDSEQPHGLQPTRLLRPWDFPGKSTGVGCHRLLRFVFYFPLYFVCFSLLRASKSQFFFFTVPFLKT